MTPEDVGRCAISTIDRFKDTYGQRPKALHFGPQEWAAYTDGLEPGAIVTFYGLPVRRMSSDGVLAAQQDKAPPPQGDDGAH